MANKKPPLTKDLVENIYAEITKIEPEINGMLLAVFKEDFLAVSGKDLTAWRIMGLIHDLSRRLDVEDFNFLIKSFTQDISETIH